MDGNTVQKSIKPLEAVEVAGAMLADLASGDMDSAQFAKVPVQERGKARFNAIIEAAEELVLLVGIDNISPHKIAKHADIPPSSVYQYFPTMAALFSVMAEKHFVTAFHMVPETLENKEIRCWQDLATVIVDSAYDFYTQDKISEILFLGVYRSAGVREYTASRLTRLGHWYIEYFNVLYRKSDLEGLTEKLVICLDVTKTIYIRSLSLHGEIREYYRDEARTLVVSYLGEFFALVDGKASKAPAN